MDLKADEEIQENTMDTSHDVIINLSPFKSITSVNYCIQLFEVASKLNMMKLWTFV